MRALLITDDGLEKIERFVHAPSTTRPLFTVRELFHGGGGGGGGGA